MKVIHKKSNEFSPKKTSEQDQKEVEDHDEDDMKVAEVPMTDTTDAMSV